MTLAAEILKCVELITKEREGLAKREQALTKLCGDMAYVEELPDCPDKQVMLDNLAFLCLMNFKGVHSHATSLLEHPKWAPADKTH